LKTLSARSVRNGTYDDAIVFREFYNWERWARAEQLAPRGDWTTWLMLGGRGSGKTRAGAEWVRQLAAAGVTPIALVGQTMTEAMAVMVRGESGLLAVHPMRQRPRIRGNVLHWRNGVEATVLSASDPDRFRGPQFAAAWCDEVAKWPNAEAAWDMLQFALRLGDRPRQYVGRRRRDGLKVRSRGRAGRRGARLDRRVPGRSPWGERQLSW
jgi:phage terminase large subunit-like protein